jgi:hypothetical protein
MTTSSMGPLVNFLIKVDSFLRAKSKNTIVYLAIADVMETEKLLRDLLKQKDETTSLEFKREITLSFDRDKNEFAKDVSAFANTKGGHIVFGKEDPEQGGRIVGIKPETFDSAQMQQTISSRCYPPVNFDAELIRIRGKWFGLLIIPESAAKPHEIMGTRDVWVRRGKTTDKATDRERMLMRRETERKSKTSGSQGAKKALDRYEEKAITTAFVTMFLMLYLPFRLIVFWILGRGLNLINWINVETVVFSMVIGLGSIILAYFFERSFFNLVLNSVRRLALPYLFTCAFFVLAVVILNSTIFLYPESVRVFFQRYWQDFLFVCGLLLLTTSAVVILTHFPITEYFSMLSDQKYAPDPRNEIRQLIQNCRHNIKLLRNRLPAAGIFTLLVSAAVIVPIDVSFGLFTPSYHNDGESFSHYYFPVSDYVYLFIYSNRVSPNDIHSQCRFYRFAQIQYTIRPAKLPLSSFIRIPNPTDISSGSTGNPSIDATSSEISRTSLGSVYINVPRNINDSFIPEISNFTDIEFNLYGASEPFTANVSYFRSLNANVTVISSTPEYSDLGNGTWLEKYTFIITNNEQISLQVMAWDFDRFNFQVVNATTTRAYSQGQELTFAHFVYLYSRLGIWASIGSGYTLNLTVTFQSSDIS